MMVSARLRHKLDAVRGSKLNPRSLPYPKASLAIPGSIRSLSQSIIDDSPQTTTSSVIVRIGRKLAHIPSRTRGIRFGPARLLDLFGAPRSALRAKGARLSISGKGGI